LKITIIIPVYNEETTIIKVLHEVNAQFLNEISKEIIVVDDGSTDSSRNLLEKNSNLFSKMLCLKHNQGKGAAVIEALHEASGDFVLIQDADLEYDPKDYEKLLNPVINFNAELVIGSRFLSPSYTRVFYYRHRIGNQIITILFNILNDLTFTDIYSGYVLFKRDIIDPAELKCVGWAQQAEILSIIVSRVERIYEVPISYSGRTYAEGKKINAFAIFPVIFTMIFHRLSHFFSIRIKK